MSRQMTFMLVSALVNCSVLISLSGVAIAADWGTNDSSSVQVAPRRMVRFNSSAPVTQSSSPTYISRPGGYGAFYTERRRQRQQGGVGPLGGPVYNAVDSTQQQQSGQGAGSYGGGYSGGRPGMGVQTVQPYVGPGGMTAADSRNAGMDSASDMGQQAQVRLQQMMEQRNQAEQQASNTMKKQSDTQSSIINNIK